MSALTTPVAALQDCARDIRRLVLQIVHGAAGGHVGGPLSAADVLAVLYFHVLNVDPAKPHHANRDRFILSKGHSTAALYSALALRGYLPLTELRTMYQLNSRLQGHPDMTRLPGLDMSTGSLGQGLSAGVGMALAARQAGADFRTYVLLGDGESQEGQVWEAAHVAARYGLNNMVAILDHNRLQQFGWREPGHAPAAPVDDPASKWAAFGWHVIEADGHDHRELLGAFAAAQEVKDRPVMLIAHTVKGQGVSFMQGNPDWHAKAPNAEQLAAALAELGGELMLPDEPVALYPGHPFTLPACPPALRWAAVVGAAPQAQRDVFGQHLADLAKSDSSILMLDGDLANSTKADLFAAQVPGQFLQMGIAEQNMVSVAAGLASCGFKPYLSTFTSFVVKRALDQARVQCAQTHLPVRLVGSYSGLMTNRTGKSHQSIEDLAVMRAMPNMVVLAPADGPELAAMLEALQAYDGPAYLRINREAHRTVFDRSYPFKIGQAVVLREGTDVTLMATGVQTTRALEAAEMLEAAGLSAYVLHLPTVKPLDVEAVVTAARATGRVVTCEEHVVAGGLGGAVCEVLSEHYPVPVKRLGLQDVFAESGGDDELLEKYGLSARHVAEAATAWARR
jgi:transketolase